MKTIPKNLESLSFKQLTEFEARIARAKVVQYEAAQSKLSTMQAQLQQKLAKMAADLGVPATAIPVLNAAPAANGNGNGHRKPRKAKAAKVAIKYRDPANPENTWSGRGRMAGWLASKVKQGAKAETYLVR